MIPVAIGTMPSGEGPHRWAWVRDAFNKIMLASKRDDNEKRLHALYAAETYDPANLAAGAVDAIQTVSVPGAGLGMQVDAGFSLDLQGIRINAWVSAADVVSYQFSNPTAGAINLASGTVRVRVWTHIPA